MSPSWAEAAAEGARNLAKERHHHSCRHMSLQGQTAVGTAQEVLEALQVCAGRGAARPVCALAAASFRAATLLGMTCAEAARLGPRQSLQILLMKGPSAAPVRALTSIHAFIYGQQNHAKDARFIQACFAAINNSAGGCQSSEQPLDGWHDVYSCRPLLILAVNTEYLASRPMAWPGGVCIGSMQRT